MWLMALVLSIGAGIVGGILGSPFKQKANTNTVTSISYDFNSAKSLEDIRAEANKAVKDNAKDQFNFNYLMRTLISQAISWGIGLVVIGALLELYNKRKATLHVN